MALESMSPPPKAEAAPAQLDAPAPEAANAPAKLPLHEDAMQLARLGEIGPMKALFDQKKIDKNFHDEEGITPLHVCCAMPASTC